MLSCLFGRTNVPGGEEIQPRAQDENVPRSPGGKETALAGRVVHDSAAQMTEIEATFHRSEFRSNCTRMHLCMDFLKSLGIDQRFFDHGHNRCFCQTCGGRLPGVVNLNQSESSEFTEKTSRYELPHGWCGFGLKLPPRHMALEVFQNWSVSFHGCPAMHVDSILKHGSLRSPGETLLDGSPLKNHATGGGKDRLKVYTSPSVLYSGLAFYTAPSKYNGSTFRVVLQCRQKTKNTDFCVGGETIGWDRRFPGRQISRHFDNSELEWSTRASDAVIPYRILVSMNLTTREEEEEQVRAAQADTAVNRCRQLLSTLPQYTTEEWQSMDGSQRIAITEQYVVSASDLETLLNDLRQCMGVIEVQEPGWRIVHLLSRSDERNRHLVKQDGDFFRLLCRTILQPMQIQQLRQATMAVLANLAHASDSDPQVLQSLMEALETHTEVVPLMLERARTLSCSSQGLAIAVVAGLISLEEKEHSRLHALGVTDQRLLAIFEAAGAEHETVLRRMFNTMMYIVQGVDAGRNAWYVVKVDWEKLPAFQRGLDDDIIHLEQHGHVIRSAYQDNESKPDSDVEAKRYTLRQMTVWMRPCKAGK